MSLEDVRKELVVAKPVAFIIQQVDKQVASLQGTQQHVAFLLLGDSLAQRAAQPIENGRLQQEAPDLFGLMLEDLFDQVVHNVPVVSGKSPDEPGDVLAPLHRECRQLEPRNPAFGAGLQRANLLGREVQPHYLVEKFGSLSRSKTQVCDPQFGQLTTGAQPGQGQIGVFAGGYDQVHLGRQVLEQKGDGFVDRCRPAYRFGIDHVVIVDDQGEIIRDGGNFIDQDGQDRFD